MNAIIMIIIDCFWQEDLTFKSQRRLIYISPKYSRYKMQTLISLSYSYILKSI